MQDPNGEWDDYTETIKPMKDEIERLKKEVEFYKDWVKEIMAIYAKYQKKMEERNSDTIDVLVWVFPNGMVACCDEKTGEQIPEYQGSNAMAKLCAAEKAGKIRIVELKK